MSDESNPARLSLDAVIATATTLAFTYALSILFIQNPNIVFGLLIASMIPMGWMVLRILKDPYITEKTFDEYFYQDRPDIRLAGKEEMIHSAQ